MQPVDDLDAAGDEAAVDERGGDVELHRPSASRTLPPAASSRARADARVHACEQR